MFFKVRDKCDLLCGRGLEAGQGWKGQWLKMIRGLNGVEMIEKFFFFLVEIVRVKLPWKYRCVFR